MGLWATNQCRSYTSEYPRITTKLIKAVVNDPLKREWYVEYAGVRVTVAIKEDLTIYYKLASGVTITAILSRTQVSYGERYWFICPHCGNRYAHLYYTRKAIACRHCFKLHFASQSESERERLMRKIRKKRKALFHGQDNINDMFESSYAFHRRKFKHTVKFNLELARLIQMEKRYWAICRDYLDRVIFKTTRS